MRCNALYLPASKTTVTEYQISREVIWWDNYNLLLFVMSLPSLLLSSVLLHCWLGDTKGIWPVEMEWWGVGMVTCLGWSAGFDCIWSGRCHCQCYPKTPSSLASLKMQNGFTFLILSFPGCPGKQAIKQCIVFCLLLSKILTWSIITLLPIWQWSIVMIMFVCLCTCISWEYISFTFSVHVIYGHSSVVLWQCCDMLSTFVFVDDVLFAHLHIIE